VDEQIRSRLHVLELNYERCQICLEDFIGSSHFLLLNPCMHVFCKQCMRDFCENLINEGSVEKLQCPLLAPDSNKKQCGSHIRETDLIHLDLSQELLEKFNKFAVSKAIDQMEDYGWCPQCESPAEVEKVKGRGYCVTCGFIFCLKCNQTYHMFKRCENLKITLEMLDQNMSDLKSGKNVSLKEELLSLTMDLHYINKHTRKCPTCDFRISKIEGCNKMTCSQCGNYFCWACGTKIKGYDHFQNNPNCWGALEADIADRMDLNENDFNGREFEMELISQVKQRADCFCLCPNPECSYFNRKSDVTKINDIECERCHTHFCFSCNEVIATPTQAREGTDYLSHFKVSDCYYKDLS